MKYYIKPDGRLVIRTKLTHSKKSFVVVDEAMLEQEKKNALTIEAKRLYARLQREIRRAKNPIIKKKINSDFWQDVATAASPEKMAEMEQEKAYNSNNKIRDYKVRSGFFTNKRESGVDLVAGAMASACGLD